MTYEERRAETYDKADADTRSAYEQKARDFLYEGLDAAFVEHNKMLKTLARAFYKIDSLKVAGRIA